MNHLQSLIAELTKRKIQLSAESDKLHIRAPKGAMTAELQASLKAEKINLIAWLEKSASAKQLPVLKEDLDNRFLPFPLTDIQQAYWVGNAAGMDRRGRYHYYLEFDIPNLDHQRLSSTFNTLIERHEMLRAIVLPHGEQQILASVPHYEIAFEDLSNLGQSESSNQLTYKRQLLSNPKQQLDQWPLFDIQISQMNDTISRVHVGLDLIVLDSGSMMILFREWQQLYQFPELQLEPLSLSFRDYVLAQQALENSEVYQNAKSYWQSRLVSLPPAPELPTKTGAIEISDKFQRLTHRLPAHQWQSLKEQAQQSGVTPSALLLSVFSEVLSFWSGQVEFTLNLTLFNRMPVDSQINQIIGDFTSVTLLHCDLSNQRTLLENVKQMQRQLSEDMEHRHYPGIQVLRDWAKLLGGTGKALAPVIFSSTLVLDKQDTFNLYSFLEGELTYALSQTPQLFLDHQLLEDNGQLIFHWDYVEGYYPDGLIEAMFQAYTDRIIALTQESQLWQEPTPSFLPPSQRKQRQEINDTTQVLSSWTLTDLFLKQVQQHPDKIAIQSTKAQFTYADIYRKACHLARQLKKSGASQTQPVGIILEKGPEQIVAVFAALLCGAPYLPIDAQQPISRQMKLIEDSQLQVACVSSKWLKRFGPEIQPHTMHWLNVDTIKDKKKPTAIQPKSKPDDLAYILYTSGTTGKPKGVMIEHQSVINRMIDVTDRFRLQHEDVTFGLTALHHDLSVFDIFATLCCFGGTLVLPEAKHHKDPVHWQKVISQFNVTLWNSVPAFMDMFITHLKSNHEQDTGSLRWVILSGDFIPLSLPERIRTLIPTVDLVSAGGPTETTVWDICYPVGEIESDWSAIPYGCPMNNATYYILNPKGHDCPDWTIGEMYIGGTGLARGFWQDEERTKAVFIEHPQTHERLYRSGDIGRFHPNGYIEIQARKDFQLKIQGQRIDLSEIEHQLLTHPDVQQAVVVATASNPPQLIAHVVTKQSLLQQPDTDVDNDTIKKMDFKLKQHGLNHTGSAEQAIQLPRSTENPQHQLDFLLRQSHRHFLYEPIALEHLADWLSNLQQRTIDNAPLPKYQYPSAGGLYPVQTYLHVKADRIWGLNEGFYYYHPQQHALLPVDSPSTIPANFYSGVNKPIFEQAGVMLFLIGKLDAVEPIYPGKGLEFCHLEAGYMSQLLMEKSPIYEIGLCPAGDGVNLKQLADKLALTADQHLVHTLMCGKIDAEWSKQWMAYHQHQSNDEIQATLQSHLKKHLPYYMLPAQIQSWDRLPLTANGKVNRKALMHAPTNPVDAPFVPAKSKTETELKTMLCDILEREDISITQPFFELGANSVHLVQFRQKIEAHWQKELQMADLFSQANLQSLAAFIDPVSDQHHQRMKTSLADIAKKQRAALTRRSKK
ncbi:non-ribosomal peptide synthetase [Algicola sagamiensis]|uniref:non-ribosomal peptide synthetase n=1 Tax=Algicola sagamiensis TaxID=163869 RepID=UPI000368348B|nr:non-ribosomal peptide synthetase [Algicola sagamiensis]